MEAIQKYPLLSKEEEIKIATRYYEEGDPEDAEILVTSNLRFVVKVAAEYSQFGSKLIDLIQEGNVGLMHAVKEYNPYKGARLITYAVWWIRGFIQDYLMKQHSMVKIGTTHNQRKLFYNLEKEKNKLDQMGMEPTVKLLSDRLGVPEKDVRLMEKRMSGKDLSLDQPVGDESSSRLLDFEEGSQAEITEQLIEKESIAQLQSVLENLKEKFSDKELYILETRLLNDEPKTLQEIGDEWNVTREAVRQMEARLLKKIKKEMIPQ
jgi:RNA polymerase sigma-32 factor